MNSMLVLALATAPAWAPRPTDTLLCTPRPQRHRPDCTGTAACRAADIGVWHVENIWAAARLQSALGDTSPKIGPAGKRVCLRVAAACPARLCLQSVPGPRDAEGSKRTKQRAKRCLRKSTVKTWTRRQA